MKTLILLICLCAAPTLALAKDACDLLEEQVQGLTQEEASTFRRHGFVRALYLPDGLPITVISKRIIHGCRERLLAEKYFDNKIAGESLFPIGKLEFENSRPAVAFAACEALKVSAPWTDGVSHEILNVVSNELFPYWTACIQEHIENSKITIELFYFTTASFERPPSEILSIVRQKQRSKLFSTYGMALLLFLDKNLTRSVAAKRAKFLLNSAEPVNDQKITNQQIIDRALRLLAKPGVVTFDAAIRFGDEIYEGI
jgi:hypothetical protein